MSWLQRGGATVMVLLCLPGGLAACGGDDSADSVEVTTRAALRSVEPDLERLASAVTAAEADDEATLIEVNAAAARASESLGDARRELRSIADSSDVSGDEKRELEDEARSLRDLQELADALATPKLSTPRLIAAEARARLARDDLDGAMEVPAINAGVLAEDLRKTRASKERARAKERDDEQQTGQPSDPVGAASGGSSGSSAVAYVPYTGPAFQAQIPTGSGWGSPSESQPTPGELFRTNVRGPDGLFVIIDFTPFEIARFGGSYSERTVVGQTAFGSATKYVFRGGRIPECQRSTCYDYIINEVNGGSGFAVLAGGGPGAAEIARTVAESVVPTG